MRWLLMDWMVCGSSDEAAVDWPQLVHASSWSLVVACGWLDGRRMMTKHRTATEALVGCRYSCGANGSAALPLYANSLAPRGAAVYFLYRS